MQEEENNLNAMLESFGKVKLERDALNAQINELFTSTVQEIEQNYTISVKGNPTLAQLRTIMLGIKNTSVINKSAEVWFNELRMSDLENDGDYKWLKYKATYAGHLLQGLPAFSRFDIPIGGDRNIVNATSENHGPSWRMIVEMTSPPTALGIYPGGQSGNPGSKYYDNFIDDWAEGKYHELNFLQSETTTAAMIGTLTLKPTN